MIENSTDASKLEDFFTTWREASLHPTSFFRRVPREGGIGAALLYYLILAVIVAGINLFWSSLFGFMDLGDLFRQSAEASAAGDIVEFLLTPLFALLGIFIITGICHLLLKLLRGANHGFDTSLRVLAYSYSPAALAIVPLIGPPVGFVWMVVLAIIGLREAHETDGAKAATAVLVPVFFFIISLTIAAFVALTMGVLNTKL